MTTVGSLSYDWMAPIGQMLDAHAWRGNYLIALQTYRPDVVGVIADEFDLAFCDFRAAHMAQLGWRAAELPLARLNQVAADASADQGLVLHNAEALLATKSKSERSTWFSEFVQCSSRHPVLIPLSIFFDEAPEACARVAWIDPTDLPAEKLLIRLASQ